MGNEEAASRHEDGLAYFVAPHFRTRFRGMLGGKGRTKLRGQLCDFDRHLDPRFAEPLGQRDPYEVLRARGAPDTCYVVSYSDELDGREIPLCEAVTAIHGWGSALLSCIPGRLAYFEGEMPDSRCILQRTAV